MRGPYRDNLYAITTGELPDGTHVPLLASDDQGAREQAHYIAERDGVDLSTIRIFYCVQITAFTRWVELGDDPPDYTDVIDKVFRDFT